MVFNMQKSNAKRRALRPKLKALKRKYATNPGLYQEESMLLQSKYGISSVSGCLSSVVSMLILYGMVEVIYHPCSFILGMQSDELSKYANELVALSNVTGFKLGFINPTSKSSLRPEVWNSQAVLALIIPSISAIVQLISQYLSTKRIKKYEPESLVNQGSTKFLSLLMPLFSIVMSYTLPLGIGLYWASSAVFSFLTTLILWAVFNPTKDEKLLESTELVDKENWKYKLIHSLNNPPTVVKKKIETVEERRAKVKKYNEKIDRAVKVLAKKYKT